MRLTATRIPPVIKNGVSLESSRTFWPIACTQGRWIPPTGSGNDMRPFFRPPKRPASRPVFNEPRVLHGTLRVLHTGAAEDAEAS